MANSPRARALAAELRAARKSRRLSQGQIADQIGWSIAKVSRVETAKTGITEADVSALLAVLGVRGKDRDHLLKMARELDQPAWWELHSGLPAQMRALIDAEQRAKRITYVSTSYLPGLLQTRSYSRAIFEVGEQTEREIEEAVAVRQSRQGVLDKPNPAELLSFLDETVLMRPVGGPAVAADQLRYVLKAVEQANIVVRVLPLSLGAHMGLDGVFSIIEFVRGTPNVYVEAPNAGLMVSVPADVDPFRRAVDRLAQVALGEVESAQVIAEHAERMEGEAG
ncbi:helix-turn-helix domain-containing protein [Saccharopolyspora sp. 5N708]|uniref:helix-turn-helix domain-containing protein n=1 Tax=Saccharopolyspora sp. 5N708 TaxID=3457424 RepID=UPI003FD4829F